ncbi:exocyst complex component 3-like protein [Megalops cyprinoides]|uniref:exocyst complex component 3-like protein n=1 Tax=Megalops cyprinoides TaxID=118141 RepID=UPI0018647A56|nr:exocyst complex component 3-like protein [Megalops cyprinoides]
MSSGGEKIGGPNSTDGAAEAWPELERAERYARGAALKWASGVFCRPEQLERLGQYRKRESQRTSAIHSRLKSVVQSYLEGVGRGLQHLRHARAELRDAALSLAEAEAAARRSAEASRPLDALREAAGRHGQLRAAVSNLPRLYAVPSLVRDAERLLQSRRLLEAHRRLSELRSWRDDLLAQLRPSPSPDGQSLALAYFGGAARLREGLRREVWAAVRAGLSGGARQDPAPFVSAVRIVEREEAAAAAAAQSDARGRGPGWRARFFEVVAETARERVAGASSSSSASSPRRLAAHLSALQRRVAWDLSTARYALEGCVPASYRLTAACLRAWHAALREHLAAVCAGELEGGEVFALLNWALHVYNSPEMMGDPALAAEVSPDELGPLLPPETLEQLQDRYVQSVRSSLSEWMQKALEVEAADWRRDQEPDVDHEGYYHTSLPTIIAQMLEENAQVALMISGSLRDRTVQMGLYELESFLHRFREALLDFGRQHRRSDRGSAPDDGGGGGNGGFYLHYLLAAISNCIVLKASTESLQQQRRPAPPGCPARTPPGPLAALDRAVRKACRLVLEDLLAELGPLLRLLLSRAWLANEELTREMCGVLERRVEMYARARPPCGQRLQEECQRLVVVEYARALMQKRAVCRGFEDRSQLARRVAADGQQLRDVFQGGDADGAAPGLEPPAALLPVLADFIQLRDPAMLTLEVSGLVAKYPDISEEHVVALLDVRGDVPREVRGSVLDALERSAPAAPPPGYRPLFPDVLLPPPSMPFCLPTAKCA